MSQPTPAPVQTNNTAAPAPTTANTAAPALIQSQAPTANNTKAPVNNQPVNNQTARPSVGNNSSLFNQSTMDERARRGEGINAVSDRLNTTERKAPVQRPRETIEVIKEKIIWKDDPNTSVHNAGQTNVVTKEVFDDTLNIRARNILAETMAKVALLTMENNRLRWLERQHNQDISKLRGGISTETRVHSVAPVRVETETVCPTCHRHYTGPQAISIPVTSNTFAATTYGTTTNAVTRPATTTVNTTYGTTTVNATPATTYGTTTNTVTRPATTTVNATPVTTYGTTNVNSTQAIRPATTTVNTNQQTTYGTSSNTTVARPTATVNTTPTTTYGSSNNTTSGPNQQTSAQSTNNQVGKKL